MKPIKNLLQHTSLEIRQATIQLLDALTQYERSTGRNYLVIVKVDGREAVHEYRSLSGGPAAEHDSDANLIEAFQEVQM